MIALPDTTKIEVMIARMILSLFDIELLESFELLIDIQLFLEFWQVDRLFFKSHSLNCLDLETSSG